MMKVEVPMVGIQAGANTVAPRRVTFGNIDSVFTSTVKRRFSAIIKRAAIAGQRCWICGKWRAFRQKGQPERADKDKK